ncbi:hypothetical protein Tco_0273675 [Tanacetum coccineum]
MHDDFIAVVYPQVHESLKHPYEEHVHLENPLSSTGTLSSMKNLDNFTFGDQFIADKSPEDELINANMETEVKSMVIALIHHALSYVPLLSTPVIDLTPPKPGLHVGASGSASDLSKADMKEILHQQMFDSSSYKSHHVHKALYEALEVFTDRDNQEELHETLTTSRKRHRDDQDPSPPPPTKESKQNVEHIPDSEDACVAHLPKIKTRPYWLKPILEEDRPKTPEPDWFIPPNDLPEPKNNWANAFATSYKDPEENKLLHKTGDMGSFIKWYCRQIGKSKLSKADFEGSAYKVVRAFHSNSISLQFQMEECHLLLTDQIDLVNLEGHRVVPNMNKPLHLGGPPGQPNDFEDLYLLHLQGKLNHLSGSNKVNLFNAPRAIIYRDRNDQKKMMRENEVHKLSDGTLTRILERLDHMVKDFRLFKYNSGIEKRIWSEDDRRRRKEFMEVIERRLKIRRIFRSLESFVSGSQNQRDLPRDNPLVIVEVLRYDIKRSKSENKIIVSTEIELVLEQTQQGTSHEVSVSTEGLKNEKELSNTYTGNPIKEILHNLNLPGHMSVLTDPEVQVKMEMEIPRSSKVNFITTCSYLFNKSKDIMKAQVYVSKLL